MRFPMVQPVTEMTRTALGARLAPGADEYLDMFQDGAVFDFPFSPGGPVHIQGKAAMADYLGKIEGSTIFDRFDLKASYPIRGDGMVLEYRSAARVGKTGAPFQQDYVAVVRTSAGRGGFYREYFDPLNIPGVADQAAETKLDNTSLDGPVTSLDAILKDQLGDRLAPGAATFLDMFAENGVLECPFAPPGALRHLQGKAAIADYYGRLTAVQGSEGMVLTASYPAESPDHLLLEYDGVVSNKRDGGVYRQRYVAIAAVSDGRLSLFREYWNPLPVVASFGPAGPIPLDAANSKTEERPRRSAS